MENVQRAWAEITTLMKKSNEDLFASPEATNKMIQTGQYFGLLNEYHSKIRGWLRLFEGIDGRPLRIHHTIISRALSYLASTTIFSGYLDDGV